MCCAAAGPDHRPAGHAVAGGDAHGLRRRQGSHPQGSSQTGTCAQPPRPGSALCGRFRASWDPPRPCAHGFFGWRFNLVAVAACKPGSVYQRCCGVAATWVDDAVVQMTVQTVGC